MFNNLKNLDEAVTSAHVEDFHFDFTNRNPLQTAPTKFTYFLQNFLIKLS